MIAKYPRSVCACIVSDDNFFPTTSECGHNVHAVVVSVHVVVNEVIPSVAPDASVCDKQLVTPFARDCDPSLALQGSNHDHIGRFNDPFWFHNLSTSPCLTISEFLNSIHRMHPSQFCILRLVLDLCVS